MHGLTSNNNKDDSGKKNSEFISNFMIFFFVVRGATLSMDGHCIIDFGQTFFSRKRNIQSSIFSELGVTFSFDKEVTYFGTKEKKIGKSKASPAWRTYHIM